MQKEESIISIIVVEQVMETQNQCACQHGICHGDIWLEPKHLEKLKNSVTFQSKLYNDAQKKIH